MSWETIQRGRNNHLVEVPGWTERPMVSMTKIGITINAILLDALSLKAGDHVLVLIDRAKYKIGLKIAETEEDRLGAFVLRKPSGKRNLGSKAMIVACAKAVKAFPLARGAYDAAMPNGSMVIEVQLPCPRLPVEPKPTS